VTVHEFTNERDYFFSSVLQNVVSAVVEAMNVGPRESPDPLLQEVVVEDEVT
jgi:hypothetical protein